MTAISIEYCTFASAKLKFNIPETSQHNHLNVWMTEWMNEWMNEHDFIFDTTQLSKKNQKTAGQMWTRQL
jgi:hypothetical protein